jgi:hypothetical protein
MFGETCTVNQQATCRRPSSRVLLCRVQLYKQGSLYQCNPHRALVRPSALLQRGHAVQICSGLLACPSLLQGTDPLKDNLPLLTCEPEDDTPEVCAQHAWVGRPHHTCVLQPVSAANVVPPTWQMLGTHPAILGCVAIFDCGPSMLLAGGAKRRLALLCVLFSRQHSPPGW